MSNVVVSKITKSGDTGYFASQAYFTCTTGASTVAKVATSPNSISFTDTSLVQGMTIQVKFTNTNTATNPTLKVGSSTAKSIKIHGTDAPGTTEDTSWSDGSVLTFTYDGSYWQLNNWLNTSSVGVVNSYANVDLVTSSISGGIWTATSGTISRNHVIMSATSIESFVLTTGDTWEDQYYFVRLAGTPFTSSGLTIAKYIDVRENLLGVVTISLNTLTINVIKNNSTASLPNTSASTSSPFQVRFNYLIDLLGDSGGDLNNVM